MYACSTQPYAVAVQPKGECVVQNDWSVCMVGGVETTWLVELEGLIAGRHFMRGVEPNPRGAVTMPDPPPLWTRARARGLR